jgi:CRP-like cAMP-binding protein
MSPLSAVSQQAWDESFLAELPPHAVEALLDTAVEIEVAAGQLIYRELVHPTGAIVALIAQGLARVYVTSPRGREVTIRYARTGDVVGLPAVVAGGAPTGVQAVTSCRVVQMQVRTLRHLASTDPTVAWAVCRKLTSIVFEVIDVLADNVFKSVNERVARALLELAREEGGVLVVRASQQELADEIGSVREVVARAIRQLRDAGVVDRKEQRIILRDAEALRRLVAQESRRDMSHGG